MAAEQPQKFMIFGGFTGWIGQLLAKYCTEHGLEYYLAKSRLENRQDVIKEMDEYKPTHVLNACGLTGRPTVDWCEDHKEDVIRVNVCGTLLLADLCETRGIHMTNYATGCIFLYDDEHKIGGGKTFTEEDHGNFTGSFYSYTKGIVEDLLRNYKNCLTLRVRMPISADLTHRNFVTKILNYRRVVDIPNSMTVLDDFVPISVQAAQKSITGILNFCNPGPISHNEVLALYREYVDPTYIWENFTLEEHNKILKAGRSNNTLSHDRLRELFPDVPDIHTSMIDCFKKMKATIDKEGKEALTAKGWKFPPSRDDKEYGWTGELAKAAEPALKKQKV